MTSEEMEKAILSEIDADPEAFSEASVCTIDPNTRVITVPASLSVFGTESDEKTNRIPFRCPRVVGDNVDLSNFQICINFRNANSEKDRYIVEDMMIDGDEITFSWSLSRKVTKYKGRVSFIVCALNVREGNIVNEWNTTLASGIALEGLEADEVNLYEEEKDIVLQLLAMVDEKSSKALEEIEAAKNEAVKEVQSYGGVLIDRNLENEGQAADAKVTGDKIAQLRGDLFNYEESLGWVKNNPQLPTLNYKWYNAYFTDTGLYTVSDKYIQMPEWETNYIVDKDIKITVNSGYVFNVFFFSHKNAFNPDNFVGKLKESFDSNEAVIEYNKYKNLYYSIVIGKEDGTAITTDECINVKAFCKCKLYLPYVTPEMFGAKGDGLTNDGKALRLALTSGKKLIIPQKTYAFDYLKLPNGCEIEGCGENSILLNSFETTEGSAISLSSVENIRVHLKNFKLLGNSKTIDGIRIDNTDGPSNHDDHWHVIDSIHIEGFKNGLSMIKNRECRTINCTLRNCVKGAYYYNCSDGSITLCTASQNSEEGFHITQGSNYRIINNKAFMNKNGFYINEYTEWGNIIVSCCEEQDNSQYGYYLDTSKNITISDCLGGGTPNSIVVNGITGLNVSGHFMIRGQGHKILKTIGALKNAKIDVFTNNLVDENVLYEFSETPINTKLVIDMAEQVIN